MGTLFKALFQNAGVLIGTLLMTFAFFFVLPLIQALHGTPEPDTLLHSVDTAALPPPPPPAEDEPEQEEEQEDAKPELEQDTSNTMDLNALSAALNPGVGSGGWGLGDASLDLGSMVAKTADVDSLFSLSELDQKPRVVYQPGPVIDARVKKKAPGTVYVLFVVEADGRVRDAKVQSSTDPVFERPAVAAVKRWKFEPGKRQGKPVRFRMRVPVTFPKG
ncbi:MAG: energy transducer TonB [Planctomycetes bacterium]|nr:energy transducer TonB [Planctomycetota bacterium]